MENGIYSREKAIAAMQKIRRGVDKRSKRLFEKYESMHDAYIRRFEIVFTNRKIGCENCILTLDQDYIEPFSRIIIKIHRVSQLQMTMSSDKCVDDEIYCMYIRGCEDGIQISCETAEGFNFEMVAKSMKITEQSISEWTRNQSTIQKAVARFRKL